MKDYSPQRHRVRREFNSISPLGVLSASAVTNPSESEFFLTRDTEFAEMFGLKSPLSVLIASGNISEFPFTTEPQGFAESLISYSPPPRPQRLGGVNPNVIHGRDTELAEISSNYAQVA